jgi:hypothetical protein
VPSAHRRGDEIHETVRGKPPRRVPHRRVESNVVAEFSPCRSHHDEIGGSRA